MSRTKAIAFSAVGGAVAAILTANIAFADGRGFGGGFGGRRRGDGLMLFFPLLLLIAVAALLVVLWRGRHPVTLSRRATRAAARVAHAQRPGHLGRPFGPRRDQSRRLPLRHHRVARRPAAARRLGHSFCLAHEL